MRNFVQHGGIVTVAAPYALTSGMAVLVGSLFGVAAGDAANGAPVDIKLQGIFDITALTADAGGVGAKMYWDAVNKRLTITAAGNTLVGCLTAAKTGADTTARVYLDGTVR